MRRWLPWALLGVAVAGGLLWVFVLSGDPVPVKAVVLGTGRVESIITNTKAGTVLARRRAKLSPQVGGRVVEIAKREGDWVERDTLLIRLDDATQRAQLRLAQQSVHAVEAKHTEACIQRDRARRELERKRELASQDIVSEDLLDGLESTYNAARSSCKAVAAEVEKARAQVEVVQVELSKLAIRAPFDGVLAEVAVELGEWITPSPPLIQAPSVR